MEQLNVKKEYQSIASKYKLPDYKDVNEDFELDKIEVIGECFARVVRKAMMDKVVNSLGFLDMLLNPMNAPRLYHPFLKAMNQDDKQIIEDLYKVLGEISLLCLTVELDYDEKKEADMIKKIYQDWNDSKKNFNHLLSRVHNPGVNVNKKEKSYYG